MRPDHVVSLYLALEADGIRLWLMGGWGVDALLGRQTRDHHDLDVLVEARSLERLCEQLRHFGFDFEYEWDEEAWWIEDPSWSRAEKLPTAFVYGHPDGREIDVHVVRVEDGGHVTTLWTVPYAITAAGLDGHGTVAAQPVRCLTAEMQRLAHIGYELPPHHLADLTLLSEAPVSPVPPD